MTRITFEAMSQLLQDLGFTERTVRTAQNKHHVFEHSSGALFSCRLYNPADLVTPADLFSLRYYLDARGLLEHDAFEEWTRSVAV